MSQVYVWLEDDTDEKDNRSLLSDLLQKSNIKAEFISSANEITEETNLVIYAFKVDATAKIAPIHQINRDALLEKIGGGFEYMLLRKTGKEPVEKIIGFDVGYWKDREERRTDLFEVWYSDKADARLMWSTPWASGWSDERDTRCLYKRALKAMEQEEEEEE
jgi:uncharacterized protein YihD (DUF1040 family)